MADTQIVALVAAVIAASFAVIILRNNRVRPLSVAAICVVEYALSAVAQNSTLEHDSPTMQVEPNPNLKPSEPDSPATQVAPNLEGLSPELRDNPSMQTLKSLAPELENPTTQTIPDQSTPIRPKTR